LVVCAVLLLRAAPLGAQPDRERATELFRRGNEEFARGRVHRALEAYREAWLLAKSFDIACNLGRAEAELGMSRDAAEHLDHCLRNFPASGRAELREAETRFRELYERVRSLIAVVIPRIEPTGAAVTLDGQPIGVSPLSGPLFVLPGSHRLDASLEGYVDGSRVIEMRPGETYSVRLALQRDTLRTAPPAPVERSTAEPRPLSLKLPLVVGGAGLTLLGLGAATLFSIRAGERADEAERLRGELGGGASTCGEPMPPSACSELLDATESEEKHRNLAAAGFVVSGVLAAATLSTWFFWPDPPPEGHGRSARRVGSAFRKLSIRAEVMPAAARLGLTARF
jgi:hypothetical protein